MDAANQLRPFDLGASKPGRTERATICFRGTRPGHSTRRERRPVQLRPANRREGERVRAALGKASAFVQLALAGLTMMVAATLGCVDKQRLTHSPDEAVGGGNASANSDATSSTKTIATTTSAEEREAVDAAAKTIRSAAVREAASKGVERPIRVMVGGRIPVVASFSILGEWIERVAGDRAEVSTLVGPGGDAHTYEPTPQSAALVADARLVFEIGLGFEGWLDKVYQSSGSQAVRHTATRAIRPRFVGPAGPSAELDPHVWQSPQLAQRMVQEVMDAFEAADPAQAALYRARGEAYQVELQALDAEIRAILAEIPRERRVLVTTHDTFGYFAADYGFEVLSVLESFSSEGGEPSAGELAKVVERIKARRVPAIFAENILDPRTTERVASEAGVSIVGTLYTDALGPPGSAGATYHGMMRYNARTIAEALR